MDDMEEGFESDWKLSESEARYGSNPIYSSCEGMRDSVLSQLMDTSTSRERKEFCENDAVVRPEPSICEAGVRFEYCSIPIYASSEGMRESVLYDQSMQPPPIRERKFKRDKSKYKCMKRTCPDTLQKHTLERKMKREETTHNGSSVMSHLTNKATERSFERICTDKDLKSVEHLRLEHNEKDDKDNTTGIQVSPRNRIAYNGRKLDNDGDISPETRVLIGSLLACDSYLDISGFNAEQKLFQTDTKDTTKLLCGLGDRYLNKLARWAKELPFFEEIPVAIFSQILPNKWQALLLLITTSYRAVNGIGNNGASVDDVYEGYMKHLQRILSRIFRRQFKPGQFESEIGHLVSAIVRLVHYFAEARLTREENVCLQVCLLLSKCTNGGSNHCEAVSRVHTRYIAALRDYTFRTQPGRHVELLLWLPKIQSATKLLIKSKMIYIPFFLNP